jgi:hypothetical protein
LEWTPLPELEWTPLLELELIPLPELELIPLLELDCKRSVSGPAQAAARVLSTGCQFQGRSSVMRRAG